MHHITGIYYDLGLSSLHVDEAERGFSFRADGPLDMRFDTRQKLSAKDIVNHYSESELSEIFWKYGEESQSKKIAQAIIHTRKKNPIRTTKELSEILDSVHPHTKIKARIFQALRIEVNGELSMLEQSLQDAVELLKT
ncbi:MAG: 16S rRNA (cytosine(1402)-N(4))-methyltransferase RsmH [Candidatus Peribacteria bacterium]|nr:MAG: 16S rRNA (cytosine(1402)-N(4))-methyltransferase RsmH [Candidatus Peribacteria bacterium]